MGIARLFDLDFVLTISMVDCGHAVICAIITILFCSTVYSKQKQQNMTEHQLKHWKESNLENSKLRAGPGPWSGTYALAFPRPVVPKSDVKKTANVRLTELEENIWVNLKHVKWIKQMLPE